MTPASSDTAPASGPSSTVVISFLLVTHNSHAVLPGLLSSLQQHPPDGEWELIAVDNGSQDAGADLIQSLLSTAKVIRSETNHGFAWGVNRAAESARGRYYCLVNPDIEWEGGVMDRLRTCLDRHGQVGAIAPRLVNPDNRPQLSIRRFPTHGNIWMSRGTPWWRLLERVVGPRHYTCDYPARASVVEAVAAACLMVRSEVFRAVGGFDDGYFLYVEDTDFCRRLYDAGLDVWCDPTVTVRHRWSEGTRYDPFLAAHHRNSIRRYFRKFHSGKHIRNAILFTALWIADRIQRGSDTPQEGGRRA